MTIKVGAARARAPRAVRTASAVAAPAPIDSRVYAVEQRMAGTLEALDDFGKALEIMCARLACLERTMLQLLDRIAQASESLPGDTKPASEPVEVEPVRVRMVRVH